MFFYYIAEANEALIITGARAHAGEQGDISGPERGGFKIVVGKGVWALPFFQKVRRLGLQAHTTEISDDCVTKQGIPVRVRGVVVFKVGDDFVSIANAARRFLENEGDMDDKVHNVFAGHLRSIIGNMTVEEIIGERNRLAEETRKSSADEMQKLGLVIDSLQIQEVDDPTGYIEHLAKPHQVAVEAAARVAAAQRDREATQAEQEAAAQMAQSRSESEVRQAELRAQAETAQQKADQAGPLAAAEAKKAVVVAEAEVERQRETAQIAVEEQRALRATQAQRADVIVPAEAKRDAAVIEAEGAKKAAIAAAEAEAEGTKLKGEATGAATKAGLMAEAEGLRARAEALAENQDAVIQQLVTEKLPEIVGEAAKAFSSIDQLTVLNGAEGMGDMFRQALALGLGVLPIVRQTLNNGASNGTPTAESTDAERTEAR